ncbi:MAG: RodZ domain-containing protein [Sphingomicrobium sp.]
MIETEESQIASVGERLRVEREAKGLTLEDVAAQTRIPRRHLESLETGDWSALPAPTYTMGFAKSYAVAVGLDRVEIGDQLRAEMGGGRPLSSDAEVFEAADPKRAMPKWLVLVALLAVILIVVGLTWYNRRSLDSSDEPQVAAPESSTPVAANAAAPGPTPPVAQGPVAITANEPVWLQVYERGGKTLFEGELGAGQRFDVPPTATAPLLRTGKPEALRISVGTADAPAVGPAATTVRDVSLLGPDLMKGPQTTQPQSPPSGTPALQ